MPNPPVTPDFVHDIAFDPPPIRDVVGVVGGVVAGVPANRQNPSREDLNSDPAPWRIER